MLFNSYIFLFLFLPLTLLLFYRIGAIGHHRVAISILVGSSLFFYAWWNPAYLGLLIGSLIINYAFGISLTNRPSKPLLIFGIIFNLALLGYFKYFNFFIDTLSLVLGDSLHVNKIILPLAISFITFQKIAYLVDAYRGEAKEYNFLHFCLFVTFFPQLIAGPIVHHREILPQFAKDDIYRPNANHLAVGLTILAIGLFKKVVIADSIALYATPVFDSAANGQSLTFFEAWGGALAYTFQLYFDFSGYSDMAIGLARMFGILLPLNFASPYKAINIIDFWRRWHITLSRFLRDYLYIALGGNRYGKLRRYRNLLITMLLGGLWHGAGWTFIIWGGLHGIYLVINHSWHAFRRRLGHDFKQSTPLGRWSARLLTLCAVVVAWVFFRAADYQTALRMLHAMFRLDTIVFDPRYADTLGFLTHVGAQFKPLTILSGSTPYITLLVALIGVWALPNTQQLMANYQPAYDYDPAKDSNQSSLHWSPNLRWAVFTFMLLLISFLLLSRLSEFLYFRF
jgi:D-alanyl-lipoteichoic acid acyltransferase DltB (MBOAT superfamily)